MTISREFFGAQCIVVHTGQLTATGIIILVRVQRQTIVTGFIVIICILCNVRELAGQSLCISIQCNHAFSVIAVVPGIETNSGSSAALHGCILDLAGTIQVVQFNIVNGLILAILVL